ncbi:MAG: bifunctional [glutamate--ammonia ligase]-adenylyl-L-tyrosine phosphorylase/[glutamate--ammonia-ligase] adenylyltransferase [Deltaproteobacteria bacterium]
MNRVFPDSQTADNALQLFRERGGALSPKKEETLRLLASYSRFLGRAAIKDPSILDSLVNSESLHAPKPYEQTLSESVHIALGAASEAELMGALRRYKYHELSRIVYRDILGFGEFTEMMAELSDLAASAVEAVFRFFKRELKIPASMKFVVLGMGKLGGRELNLSSDIDLIYLYKGTKNPDPIFKLSEKITKALASITEDGFLYRVDLALRPGGSKSDVALSLDGALEHYFYWGDTWERAAMIKAMPIAGDIALGQRFNREIAPFVYKKFLDYASIEDLKEMKAKLNRLQKKRDVKLGRGGIREIEFFTQALQLVNGGAVESLRERSTLRALLKLQEMKIIERAVCDSLSASYLFLRRVEHAIQLVDELQTHKIPEDAQSLDALAKRVGLGAKDGFETEYARQTSEVSKNYNQLFYEPSKKIEDEGREFLELADFLSEGNVDEARALERLKNLGFKYPRTSAELIGALLDTKKGGLTQKGRTLTRRVVPAFLGKVIYSADPDAALRNLERFISGIGWRTSIFAMLSENPDILELLSRLFSTSAYLSNFLIRHPEYLDVITLRSAWREFRTKREMLEELKRALSEERDYEGKLNAIRRFKNVETLKLCLRDLNGELDAPSVGESLANLADAMMEVALGLAGESLMKKSDESAKPSDMAILGMGKLGGREMSYNSDLDIIFIYPGENHEFFSKLGQRMISVLSIPTAEGFAYKIDMGLRPSGKSGALVSSLESFRSYHEASARLWERQALIRARACAGSAELGRETIKAIRHFVYEGALDGNFHSEINHMRSRMERELAKEGEGKFNLKTGRGGIVDAEFLAQMLQLKFGSQFEEMRTQNTLSALSAAKKRKIIAGTDFSTLADGLSFLKRLENLLRLLRDSATSELGLSDFTKLAMQLGIEGGGEELRRTYIAKTDAIRAVYLKYFS